MKKSILFLTLTLLLVLDASAQNNVFEKTRNGSLYIKDEATVGIKLGGSLSKMRYSLAKYQNVSQEFISKPAFGFYVDYHFNRVISIAPEILYSSNGVYHRNYTILSESGLKTNYRLIANYVSFRLPLVFKMNVSNFFKPYVFIAPEFSGCISGKLNYGGKNYEITEADLKEWDFSAIAGLGFRFRINLTHTYLITKIDVGYNYSFTNNYGTAVKTSNVEMGKRYNSSLECMLTIGLPLNVFQDKNCVDFNSPYDIWY